MKARIGYFVPEFPGQTHIFLWRERQALDELGIEADLTSTRRPPRAIMSQSWAQEAEKNTDYLVPLTFKDFVGASTEILRAGPSAWLHCLAVVTKAKDLSFFQKLRLLAMIFLGGKLAWLAREDRKSTRLNSSHANISYAVFCLKKNTYAFFSLPTHFFFHTLY